MTPEQIKAKVGEPVTEAEMVDMLQSNPIGTSPDDVRVRSGVLSFSFGPGGVKLTGAEVRTPLKPTGNDQDQTPAPSQYQWEVVSTVLSEVHLILQCAKTGKRGRVKDPSAAEWAAAFSAPTKPYPWTGGDGRVEVLR